MSISDSVQASTETFFNCFNNADGSRTAASSLTITSLTDDEIKWTLSLPELLSGISEIFEPECNVGAACLSFKCLTRTIPDIKCYIHLIYCTYLKETLQEGSEEDLLDMQSRARDLFYGLWVNDLFMKRVEANQEWSLFCPSEAPGLADVWGDAFDALYTMYEKEGRAKKVIKAQQLWFSILEAQASELYQLSAHIHQPDCVFRNYIWDEEC